MPDSTAPPTDQAELSAELVREVAEKVWRLWLRDLRLEKERSRLTPAVRRARR